MSDMIRAFVLKVFPRRCVLVIKNIKRFIMLRLFRKHIVKRNYCGFPLSICIEDPMAEGWYGQDWKALPELELLQKGKLKQGAKVFDLGAHQGVVAAIIARIVKESGKVLAVEADPHNYKIAVKNRDLNGIEQLTVLHNAISEKIEEISFNVGLNGRIATNNAKELEVLVMSTTIDELSSKFGDPDVLFIDIEGCEVKALEGASQTLLSRPDCFVEVHVGEGLEDFGSSADDVVSFFPASDYNLFVKTEKENEFSALAQEAILPTERFFLVALAQ